MKRLLLATGVFLVALSGWAVDPADQFLQAYFLIQEGDAALQKSDPAGAADKYRAARALLESIHREASTWNPHIIEFRLKYCDQKLLTLPAPAPAAPVPAVAPVAPSAAPAPTPAAVEPARVAELTAELAQARTQIQQLEAARAELNDRLQAALQEVPVTQTSLRVEQLLEKNQELTATLAAAQQTVATLTERAGQLAQAQEQVRQLEADRDRLRDQLAAARAAPPAPSAPDPRLAELIQRNQELTAQLTAAQQELLTARSAAGSPAEVQQLRAELQDTRSKLALTEHDLAATRTALTQTRQELELVRTERNGLRQDFAALRLKLEEASRNLLALQQAGQKDTEIILFLRKENELLKQLVDRRDQIATRRAREEPVIPELKGWRPRRRAAPPKPAPTPAPAEEVPAAKLTESAPAELVAEIAAPVPPPAPEPAAPLKADAAKATVPVRPEVPTALATGNDTVQTLLQEARAAAELQDVDTAVAKYTQVLETNPDNLLALSNLGVIEYRRGQFAAAEQHLRRGVALAPNDSESRSLLGIIYLRQGKIEEAYSELTRAVALNPRNAEAHNYLGITLSEKDWAAAAEQELRKAVELNPQYADAHFNLAVLYAGQRTPRLELARYHYQKALDLGATPDAALDKVLRPTPAPTRP